MVVDLIIQIFWKFNNNGVIAALLLLFFRKNNQQIKMHLNHEKTNKTGFYSRCNHIFLHIGTVGHFKLVSSNNRKFL